MPFLVRVTEGDNPRELAENLSDDDAKSLAVRVSQETGEEITLVPYVYDAKSESYVLDEKGALTVQHTADVAEQDAELDTAAPLESMNVAELKAYAAKHTIDITGLKKKADLFAAIAKAQA